MKTLSTLLLFSCGLYSQSAQQMVMVAEKIAAGGGSLSFVAAASANGCTVSPFTTAVAGALNVSAGDTLIIGVGYQVGASGTFILTPTTSAGDTPTVIPGTLQVNNWDAASSMAVYKVASASASGSYVVTGNFTSGGPSCTVVVFQFRNSSAGAIDVVGTNFGAYSTSTGICVPSTGGTATTCTGSFTPGTTGQAGILFVYTDGGSGTFTAGNILGSAATIPSGGFTAGTAAMEYLLNIGTGTGTAAMTFGSSNRNMGVFVSLKP